MDRLTAANPSLVFCLCCPFSHEVFTLLHFLLNIGIGHSMQMGWLNLVFYLEPVPLAIDNPPMQDDFKNIIVMLPLFVLFV